MIQFTPENTRLAELFDEKNEKIANLEAAVEFAKREFYARGRRDLVLELLGELGYNENPERILEAVAAGEDFTEHPRLGLDKLARFYFQTVDEMKQVPRGAKGGH